MYIKAVNGWDYVDIKIEDLASSVTPEQERVLISKSRELLEDIRKNGVREPVIVVWLPKDRKWFILDGDHRFVCAKILGISVVKGKTPKQSPKDFVPCPHCDWTGEKYDLDHHTSVRHRKLVEKHL